MPSNIEFHAQDFCEASQRRGSPAAPVNSLSDALADPHLAAIDFWQTTKVSGIGDITWPGEPFRLPGYEPPDLTPAPPLANGTGRNG